MNKAFETNCTIVVSTCDAYEDLWDAFCLILSKAWPEMNLPVVFNTEHKDYSTPYIKNFSVHNQREEGEIAWSKRLKDTLKDIETDFVIFMLDDFFAKEQIDSARIEQCYHWMEADKRIAVFYFMQAVLGKRKPSNRYSGFEKLSQCADYKYNCQAGIWRRECLIKALAEDENPWQWEWQGTFRSYRDFGHDYYALMPESGYIIPYIDFIEDRPLGGLPVCRGRWYVPCAKPIFEKYGIEMDFSKRGEITAEEIYKPAPAALDPGFIKNAYHIIRRWMENVSHIIKGK